MKQQIALTAIILALISSTVLAKESLGGPASSYKTLAVHNISVLAEQSFRRTPPVSQVVKDVVVEAQSTFHDTLRTDLSAKIEATISYSLQERSR